MLVLFRFRNYGSFKDEAVLDMRAIKSYKEHPYNLITESENESLLKTVAIYGANASGKSNFVNAYRSFMRIVQNSFQKNNKEDSQSVLSEFYYPFFFDSESTASGTEFEAVYHFEGNEYRYGFVYNEEMVEYEWLYKKSLTTNRQTTIIERSLDGIKLGSSVRNAIEKYIGDIDSDVLALSFFSSLRLRTHVFKDTVSCINAFLPISFLCDYNNNFILEHYFKRSFDKEEKPRLLAFLNAIDVGIKDIEVEKNNNKIAVFTSHIGRDKQVYRVPLEIESDGTIRAIMLYSLLRIAALSGQGLIIDEFNNQLHPLLQKYIIDLFYEESKYGQLIYTTHDTSLLDKNYMRRDQVWFTSKNEEGESSLYSLAEFKIRNDKSFAKDYLGGVYGGIPFLKEFSFEEE